MGGAAMLFPWTRTISVAAALALIASCGGERELAGPGDDQASIVAAVAVSPESVAMTAGGDTARLTALARNSTGSVLANKVFTWVSSAPAVAAVNGGLVSAVAEGNTTITATCEGKQGSALVWVGTRYRLIWPIDCVPGVSCLAHIGYPDIDENGQAFNCGAPGYTGHQGTDINLTWAQMDSGVDVLAAAAGLVLWVFDGKYDRCPDVGEPDCQPPGSSLGPGISSGHTVCTALGDYCGTGTCCCYWCFAGGNVLVIRHTDVPGVFATRYDHLKRNSIIVAPGEYVQQGQKIAEAGSAGNSSGPHLHFEVWGAGFYQLADPWAGACGPNVNQPLWAFEPPWEER